MPGGTEAAHLMCYRMCMAASSQSKASARMVVLLRPSEKKRLQKLAEREHVSSAEILRRSFHAYEQNAAPEEDSSGAILAEMNRALDSALEAVRSARAEVAENLTSIQKIRAVRV